MSDELDYVALRPCGCMAMWCSAECPAKDIAAEVGKAIRRGYSVQRVTTDAVRAMRHRCEACYDAEKKKYRKVALS